MEIILNVETIFGKLGYECRLTYQFQCRKFEVSKLNIWKCFSRVLRDIPWKMAGNYSEKHLSRLCGKCFNIFERMVIYLLALSLSLSRFRQLEVVSKNCKCMLLPLDETFPYGKCNQINDVNVIEVIFT